ncbi:MAG TPA: diacylglycerol kinase family lipid kinase [Firmicutes bacterium]|nr:diacylglycerol kinase family lipid kinase [Bacillota bacterium]
MRYIFIINPAAGSGTGVQKIMPKIEAYFSEHPGNYKIIVTTKKRQGIELAKSEALLGGKVRIYACGGDGTLFDIVNGVAGCENVEIGIIPCGSGNDFIKYFSSDIDFFDIEAQVKGSSIPVDLINCGEYYAINQCFIGVDSDVAHNKNLLNKVPFLPGGLQYFLAIAAAVIRNESHNMELRIDNMLIPEKNYSIMTAANAPFYGGGFKSAPDALPSDGLLDFITIDHVSRRRIAAVIKKFKRGEHLGLDICHYFKGKSMTVRSKKDMKISLDGEIVIAKEITFKVCEKGAKIIVPSICTSGLKEKNKKNVGSNASISGAAPAMDKR